MTINEKISKIRNTFCNGDNGVFAARLGVSTQYASNICKNGKNVGEKQRRHILDVFPDVSRSWFLAGEGPMLKTENISDESLPKEYKLVPVYNFDAVGSMHAGNDITDAPAYIERMIPFVGAAEGDMCVHVTGNSMIPTYSPGSVLLIRKVEGWREYFGYGHCFVLFLNDGRRIIKEVQRYSEDPKDYVLCVSHNHDFPAEELPKSMIISVYKVIATLTNEGF